MAALSELSRSAAAPWARRGPVFSEAGLGRPVAWAAPQELELELGRLRADQARRRLGGPRVPSSVSSPRLGEELFARLLAYGTPHETHPGDVLFRPGDEDVDLLVVERGSVEVVRTETADAPCRDGGGGGCGRLRR